MALEAAATTLSTGLLIVGAGPAGASLACFLAAHGRTGIMISAAPGTAETPRAHITNMASLECLRDIDLERECLGAATASHYMAHTRWCRSMAGEEFARVYSWGHDPTRKVVRELKIPLLARPGQGLALNVLVKADMSHLVANRLGNLHWVFRPEEMDAPPWGWAALVRMVRPWNEWMFIMLPAPGADLTAEEMDASDDEYVARVKEFIGDDSVAVELIHVSKWWINEIVAEYYSDGNIFCLGDATHRHPPFNGLGSNTCIQDAFNLAWKIDYVMAGKAGPALLDSFSKERQPVGADVITRANQGLRDHIHWQKAMGMLEPDPVRRREILAEFEDPGEKGRKRRHEFQKAIEMTTTEFHGLGIEMNQHYVSDAVYQDDQGPPPPTPEDPVKTHQVTTYPGRRLPHVWLNTRSPGKPLSTIDLAGHGRFCLLTGPGGQEWKLAAAEVSKSLGVEIVSYSIGWKQDYEDVYFDWAKRREVEEDGCVLVRPDLFVAWRSSSMVPEPRGALGNVMRRILAL
ncbi:hypothetical protein VTK26DRAFT_4194 [Humicola hyalothermophila]